MGIARIQLYYQCIPRVKQRVLGHFKVANKKQPVVVLGNTLKEEIIIALMMVMELVRLVVRQARPHTVMSLVPVLASPDFPAAGVCDR